ncbi:MAG: hypothetical protein ABR517_14300 [Thermoanaerobaculia bacterium]
MRLINRVVFLTLLLAFATTGSALAEHFVADCPLSLVSGTPSISSFSSSPHGVFKNGSMVYLLRGQNLTTLEATALGDLKPVREDFLDEMVNRDPDGGSAYHNGYLFLGGDAGLEVWDLRNVRPNGTAPVQLERIPGVHYSRLAAHGNILAGLFPATDLPCAPNGTTCQNWIDLYNISDPAAPVLIHRFMAGPTYRGFNDIVFVRDWLAVTGVSGTYLFNVANGAAPSFVSASSTRGEFLATDGSVLAVGQEELIGVFTVGPTGTLGYFTVFTLPSIMNVANGMRFHPDMWISDSRLITLVDERDPLTLGGSARTIAIDVFDFSVPFYEGFDDRIYESVSFIQTNERLYNPVAVGPYVYVVGEVSGTQKWGACGAMAGRVELDSVRGLTCGGAEIHGWVTGANRIVNVEVFLDGDFLGNANFGSDRHDTMIAQPVHTWRLPVNLDSVARGTRTLRIIGTDALGNRFQFASTEVFFPGPGGNCTNRRRTTKR